MQRKYEQERKAIHSKNLVRQKIRSLAIILLLLSISFSPLTSQEVIDPTSLNHKIMAGYQGWFAAPGDGSGYGWIHWGGPTIDADNITIDMWPDMREYDPDELFETDFVYQDLTNAGLYSAYTRKTVERHVKWMKDYGIDGVFRAALPGFHRPAKRFERYCIAERTIRSGKIWAGFCQYV